jgi:hypothetical protein
MPVDGFEHRHVWQYRFRPQPYAVLDHGWHGRDREWELGVVERLRRGEAAPRSISLGELVTGFHDPAGSISGGWEHAEERSKNAIRNNSAFLNDEAIARRAEDRKRRKAALAEAEAQNRANVAKRKAELAAKEAERARAERAWRRRQEERARAQSEQDAEWQRQEMRRREETAILTGRWQCAMCGSLATQMRKQGAEYAVTCMACAARGLVDHDTLVQAMRRGR